MNHRFHHPSPTLRVPRAAGILLLVLAAVAPALFAAPAPAPSDEELQRIHRGIVSGIQSAMKDSCLVSARVGLLVRDLPEGRDVYSHRDGEAFTPASNMKILTAAAALDRLRPETVFRTSVRTDGPLQDGELRGDLYLVGGGDPGLVPESLFLLAMRLRARGVERITGDLVGDDTLFDDVHRPVGWPSRNFHRAFSAPFSALNVNYSAVGITVRPTVPQQKVQAEVSPFPGFLEVRVNGVTSKRTRSIQVSRTYESGHNVLTVSGYLPRSQGEVSLVRSVEDPTLYTLHGFRTLLEQQGIQLDGGIRTGPAPENSVELTYYESRPLSQLVLDLNKFSSNVMAEMLLKSLDVHVNGPPGTTTGGAAVVLDWLREIGAPTDNLRILDGSGLTEESTLTPRVLVAALEHAWEDFEIRPEFWSSLPVGGADGTLRKRLRGIGRRVRAKTGLVRGAVTLSGYTYGPKDRAYAFSLLVNDHTCPAWKVQQAMDDVVLAVSGQNGR